MILHPTSVTANMTQPTTSVDSETLFIIGVTDFIHNGDAASSDATDGVDMIKDGKVGTGRIRNLIASTTVGLPNDMQIPVVSVDELIVLLVLLPYTAVTLTVQLLPALREVMVWVVTDPLTVSDDDRYSSETHNN